MNVLFSHFADDIHSVYFIFAPYQTIRRKRTGGRDELRSGRHNNKIVYTSVPDTARQCDPCIFVTA